MIRTIIAVTVILGMSGCASEPAVLKGPPPPAAGLPNFKGAPTVYGTLENPDAFGPATARIEGNTFYVLADNNMSLFSRRISYNPTARTLTSSHRDLDLVYDETAGAFVGTLRDPATRAKRRVSVAVPASALPS